MVVMIGNLDEALEYEGIVDVGKVNVSSCCRCG